MQEKKMNALLVAWLALQASFSFYTSFLAFLYPTRLAGQLGFSLVGSAGLNELRSQYGGFFFAVGLTQLLSLFGVVPLQAGIAAGLVTFGGLMLGRLVSLTANGGFDGYTRTISALVFLDTLGFMLSFAALAAANQLA
jgi:hypothetical protein